MNNKEILKSFGQRLRGLRKQKKWTQKELAAKVEMQFGQLNKYECGFNNPPVDKLILLAEALDTTIDYLLTGNNADQRPLHNTRLLKRFSELEQFNGGEQDTVLEVLDAMIMKKKMKGVMTLDGQEVH